MSYPNPIRFFLGSNSPQGFVSRFDQINCNDPQWHTFIIKGGPGCGKSSMMRKIAEALEPFSPDTQFIACSADPDSLDAVIFPKLKFSISDGTAPHLLEPKYPGLSDTLVSLGDYLSTEKLLPFYDEVRTMDKTIQENYRRATDCFAAAKTFLSDSSRLTYSNMDLSKISAYGEHFAEKHFPKSALPENSQPPKESVRFLSALNAKGLSTFPETVPIFCPQIYFISDDDSAAAPILLNALRSHALRNGYSVITCYCPMAPNTKIDHLLVPQAGIALMTQNRFHELEQLSSERCIHATRFENAELSKADRKKINFNRKSAFQMLDSGCAILGENKALHDRMEEIYLNAMDFSHMEEVENSIIEKIKKRNQL